MANFEQLFNKFLWLGAFVFFVLAFIITIQSDNGASQPLSDEPLISQTYTQLRGNITNSENISKEQYGIFSDEQPTPGIGSIVLFTIVGASKTFGNIIVATLLTLIKLPLIVLGIDPTIPSLLMTWISISVVLGLWVVYKFGG